MQFAVMSDSHDNIWNLRKALRAISEAGCDLIIHCGDFVAPFVFKELIQAGLPVHCLFGNNDGDRYQLTKSADESDGLISLYGAMGEIKVGGLAIGIVHEETIARALAAIGAYDLVCCGHTHLYRQEKIGRTLLLNPGEIMGKEGDPGFCLVVPKTMDIRRVSIF